MSYSHRRRGIWIGRFGCLVVVVALVGYLVAVGLDRADKIASGVGAVLALLALVAPYLLPLSDSIRLPVQATGSASVAIGGENSWRVRTEVTESTGDAAGGRSTAGNGGVQAHGAGSVAIGGANNASIRTRFQGPTNG